MQTAIRGGCSQPVRHLEPSCSVLPEPWNRRLLRTWPLADGSRTWSHKPALRTQEFVSSADTSAPTSRRDALARGPLSVRLRNAPARPVRGPAIASALVTTLRRDYDRRCERSSFRRSRGVGAGWLFVFDKQGRLTSRLEGSFGFNAVERAL